MCRVASAASIAELEQRVAREAVVRVALSSEVSAVCSLMREHESVHVEGAEQAGDPRAWRLRVCGPHRFTALLEMAGLPLAYILVSAAPGLATSMGQIFSDTFPTTTSSPSSSSSSSSSSSPFRDTALFYSVASLARSPSHPFHGVSVGPAMVRGVASLLRQRGMRAALASRQPGAVTPDLADSVAGAPALFTMSPIPSLCKLVAQRNPALMARVGSAKIDALRPEIEAEARRVIEDRSDPVARFHLGNGARLHRLHWRADDSELRRQQSWGLMCNYDYN